jgi:hypothetical protein
MDMAKKIKVTNRSNGMVIYSVPDLHVNREFGPRAEKLIPYEEIYALAQQPGGRELVYNYLLVQDPDALHEALDITEQPEYWLTEEMIPTWLNSCSLNEFKDALDFAPEGVLDLIKKYAVSVPLNATDKREAIKEQLKFDVTKTIENNRLAEQEEDNTKATGAASTRRSHPTYTAPKVIKKDE